MTIRVTDHAVHRMIERGPYGGATKRLRWEAVRLIRRAVRVDPPAGRVAKYPLAEYWHDAISGLVWIAERAGDVLVAITCITERDFIRQCDRAERKLA